ncbi:alpha/beta fold hydrolase [Nocardioides convexus]|uniref:alpha/beta fold hydrolase n=1 Tax=Nocardioides convexus TaxID=2712224 RepID=UPI002418A84D|nr:alpha/beta fold hydrolase [Nocardioides convexus]
MAGTTHEVQYVTLHGKRRAFVKQGSGPALLLLHGLACDHTTWTPVIDALAEKYTVIAPDLLGHGLSDKPRADYTLGGYANGMRDLLTVLGIDKVTVVGHRLRRRGGDAVRLPVPRADPAGDAGVHRRPRARRHAADQG